MSKPDKKLYVREFYLDNHLEKDQAFNWSTKPLNGYVPVTIVRGHDPHRLLEDVLPSVPTDALRPGEKVVPQQKPLEFNPSYVGPQINIKLDPKLSNEQIMETVKTSVEKAIKEVKEKPRYRWKIKHKTTGHTLVTKYYYEKFDPNDIHEYENNCYFNYEAVGPHFDPGEKK